MKLTVCVLGALALLCVSGWCAQRRGKAGGQDAAAVYKRQCASCHGANGSGQTAMGKAMKVRDLRSQEVQRMSDQELFDITAKGKGKMPAYAKLGDETIHALVRYIRELAKQGGEDGGQAKKH